MRDLSQCNCDCHKAIYGNTVRHIMPCCFPCDRCKKRIKRSAHGFHIKQCKSYPMQFMKDTVLLTHADCIDGAGCAMVFMSAGGKRDDIHFVVANGGVKRWMNENPSMGWDSSKKLLIADVSTDHETAQLLEKRGNYTIIDHHKTAQHLSEFDNCHIDMSRCGSSLLYTHVWGEKQTDLSSTIEDINDFDMWINVRDKTSEVVDYFNFYGITGLLERAMKDDFKLEWTEEEKLFLAFLEKKKQDYIEKAMKRVSIVEEGDLTFGVVFVSDYRSDVLNRVLEDFEDVDIAAGIIGEINQISLRSRKGGPDVSVIAAQRGGGGHANAAAYNVNLLETMRVL